MACWARWHPCAMDFVERRRTPIWPQTVAPWFNRMIIGVQKLPDVDKVPNFAQLNSGMIRVMLYMLITCLFDMMFTFLLSARTLEGVFSTVTRCIEPGLEMQ